MLLDRLLANLDIQVEPFSLCQVSPRRRLRLPPSERVMLHFVLVGSGYVTAANGSRQPLAPCHLAVVPRGASHALEPQNETAGECVIDPTPVAPPKTPVISTPSPESPEMIVACGLVKVRYGSALGVFDELEEILVEDLSEIPQVQAAFSSILAEEADPGPGSDALKGALMSQCIVYLFRRLCEAGSCTLPWLATLEDERLARVLERILENPGESHSVESLADVASMSRSAFAETFSAAFGRPPMSLVRQIRMERAWKILEQAEGLSMTSVARRVGFSSRSQFSKAFKRHFGITPAERRAMPG
ncbi:MAG: AraC family transcriptional regulator [Acidobacteriota bacterium]